jgi:hypothetical protein
VPSHSLTWFYEITFLSFFWRPLATPTYLRIITPGLPGKLNDQKRFFFSRFPTELGELRAIYSTNFVRLSLAINYKLRFFRADSECLPVISFRLHQASGDSVTSVELSDCDARRQGKGLEDIPPSKVVKKQSKSFITFLKRETTSRERECLQFDAFAARFHYVREKGSRQ